MSYLLVSFFDSNGNREIYSIDYKIHFLIGLCLTVLSFLMLEESEKNFILKKTKIR